MLSITTKKEKSNNSYRKNGAYIKIFNNDNNKTIENYVEKFKAMDESAKVNREFNARSLKEITTDKNIIKVKYDIEYFYEDEAIVNKVIDI